MPYCPNSECPYRKRFGESAEYLSEIAMCSDCGTSLSEKDGLGPLPKKKSTVILTETHKRILWTLALVGFWRILSHLSLPGIDLNALSQLTGGSDSPFAQYVHMGILSLGLMAYISGYVMVEIASLFIQPLKRWRVEGGSEGRAKLVRAARWTTLVIGVYHASALVSTMGSMADGSLFTNNSPAFRALLVLTLVAGLFLTVWIADMISAKGIGHGVSILFVISYLGSILHNVQKMLMSCEGDSKVIYFVIPLLALLGSIALIVIVEQTIKKVSVRTASGINAHVPLKLTTAGLVPSNWADLIIVLPLIIIPFLATGELASHPIVQWISSNLYPGAFGRAIVFSVLVMILYYVFTAFFYNPKDIVGLLKKWGVTTVTPPGNGTALMDRSLERMALIGCLYLILMTFALDIVWRVCNIPMFAPSGLHLILIVTVALDLISEMRMRWRSEGLVKIAEFHEPWKAGLMQSVLKGKSIPSVIRGYHHRALLYFFGPYIEMSLHVPREQAEAAQEIVNEFSEST